MIRLIQTANRSTSDLKSLEILTGPPEPRLDLIRPYLQNSDAKEHTCRVAESYRDQAVESLSELDVTIAGTDVAGVDRRVQRGSPILNLTRCYRLCGSVMLHGSNASVSVSSGKIPFWRHKLADRLAAGEKASLASLAACS